MNSRLIRSFCLAVCLALPAPALADICDGMYVATGTPAGQQQIRRHFGVPKPEWTQLAAFAAAVEPEQWDYAYNLAKQRLLNADKISDDELGIFEAMFVDMRQANSAAAASATIMAGTVGGVLGLLTGDVAKGVAGAAGGGAIATQVLSFPTKIVIDIVLIQSVLDRLVHNPCLMSAGDALAELQAP